MEIIIMCFVCIIYAQRDEADRVDQRKEHPPSPIYLFISIYLFIYYSHQS